LERKRFAFALGKFPDWLLQALEKDILLIETIEEVKDDRDSLFAMFSSF